MLISITYSKFSCDDLCNRCATISLGVHLHNRFYICMEDVCKVFTYNCDVWCVVNDLSASRSQYMFKDNSFAFYQVTVTVLAGNVSVGFYFEVST